jgi:hypothetical protein
MGVIGVFCHQDETIRHLFFQCRFYRSICSTIQVASSLYPPTSVANVFGNWIHGIDLGFRTHIRVGADVGWEVGFYHLHMDQITKAWRQIHNCIYA